jgi:hypothetical protein
MLHTEAAMGRTGLRGLRDVLRGLRDVLRFSVLLLAVVAPRSALCWRQYHTKDSALACAESPTACGCGLRWYAEAIPITLDQGGLEGLALADVQTAVAASLAPWTSVTCDLCTSPDGPGCAPVACASAPLGVALTDAGAATPTAVGATCLQWSATGDNCLAVAGNGNFIRFFRDVPSWQAAANQGSLVYGLTVLTFNRQSGAIADADILLNDAHFDYCLGACLPGQVSLCNTTTHEAGHLLGLDHTPEVDATMYASAPAGETRKCDLHDDDRAGLCTVYRTACSSQGCPNTPPPADSCQTGRAASTLPAWPVWLLVLTAWAARRRLAGRRH